MRHAAAWAVLSTALGFVLVGFVLILAALGWLGLNLSFLPGREVLGILVALAGALFLVGGVAGIAISMSMRMYTAPPEGASNGADRTD